MEQKEQIILPLLDARCTFEKPLYYDDIATIITSVAEINRKTIRLHHVIMRGDTRTGQGYELRGWVKKSGNHLSAVPIPEEVRKLLEQESTTENALSGPWLMA
ncbi:hypothetical protein JIR001_03670 [Polycladomyces abyssicola]|uniref:Uncharacterized protein n=1 Tax=Polycladomyces abyssicola TaxID=1125966 RepID=A0A8D5UCM4_9BACL|nr:hypothetical protein JIR001_03670 [Polycladomyces abyssicola]